MDDTAIASLILLTLAACAAGASWFSLDSSKYTYTCNPRTTNFVYTFSLGSSAPASASAIVLQLGSTWATSGIAYDSDTNITGVRFSLSSLQPGEEKSLTLSFTERYQSGSKMLYGLVMTDGSVYYGYLSSGGPWPFSLEATPENVSLDLQIYDFGIGSSDKKNPDFEMLRTSYNESERNITEPTLGSDGLPVYRGCPQLKNGCSSVHNASTFNQWFRNVSGVNLPFVRTLTFNKVAETGIYHYNNQYFFPIDDVGYGNEGYAKDGKLHNFGFCMLSQQEFRYHGGEVFNFKGDDDVWVYIDNKMVLDLGGLHPAEGHNITVDDLNLTIDETYDFSFFYCERHTDMSTLAADTTLDFLECGSSDKCGFCADSCSSTEGGNDTDGDAVFDCQDPCLNDKDKVYPGECGCGHKETCAAAITAAQSSGSAGAIHADSSTISPVVESSVSPLPTSLGVRWSPLFQAALSSLFCFVAVL